jgi:hypothetical protein
MTGPSIVMAPANTAVSADMQRSEPVHSVVSSQRPSFRAVDELREPMPRKLVRRACRKLPIELIQMVCVRVIPFMPLSSLDTRLEPTLPHADSQNQLKPCIYKGHRQRRRGFLSDYLSTITKQSPNKHIRAQPHPSTKSPCPRWVLLQSPVPP